MALRNPVKNRINGEINAITADLETEQAKHILVNPRYKIEEHTHTDPPQNGVDESRNRGWSLISLKTDLPCSLKVLSYIRRDGTQGYWVEALAKDTSGDVWRKRYAIVGPEPDDNWVFVPPYGP